MTLSRSFLPAVFILVSSPGTIFGQSEANALLDDSKVQVLNVTMNPADWADLKTNYLQNTYYHANVTWNGKSVDLGVRSHGGGGSRSPTKPNLDFNFAHYTKNQLFLGLPFVLLKANNEDASNLREWISFKLFRRMGLPAPREAPAQLYINGELIGFYYIVEHLDETYLQRNLGESGGYLYEWQYGQQYEFGDLGSDPQVYAPFLEVKTDQDNPDLANFAAFIHAVSQNTSSESDYIAGLSPYLDPKLFLSHCATESVLSDIDGVLDGEVGLNNFYLYQFQGSTLFQLLAWDKDRAFFDAGRDILDGVTSGTNINVLAQRLYGFPDYQAVYLSEVNRAATLFGGTGGWADSEIAREYGVIRDAARNDPNKQCDYSGAGATPCGVDDFENGVTGLHAFIAKRSDLVMQSALKDGYQPIASNPQVQDVQGDSPDAPKGQFSPGALVNVLGTNLPAAANASAVPLPRVLGGSFVAVEGVRAPLFAMASGQVLVQIPGDIPTGTSSLVVSSRGALSNTLTVATYPATPSILAVVRANGSVIGAANTPAAGEYITLYAIGLGAVTPGVTLGGLAPPGTYSTTSVVPQIAIDGSPLNVVYSGLAPGYVGLFQVNAQMPATVAQGPPMQIVLSAAGQVASFSLTGK